MSTQVTTERVWNFSAGPAVLPEPVLERIRDELWALPGVGSSVMEISHRSKPFVEIINSTRDRLKRLLSIPDDYEVLMLQGGASLLNTMIPSNLVTSDDQVGDFVITGAWGKKSSQDFPFFGKLNVVWDGADTQYDRLPEPGELNWTPDAAYAHLTSNETIHGVQFDRVPENCPSPLVVDHSSDFLSRPIDTTRYGIAYACAQKNCGIAGLSFVVIRKDLLDRSAGRLPRYLDFAQHAKAGSMLNTPPTFAVYVSGLVFEWLEETIGGLDAMQKINEQKAAILYTVIDQSQGFYAGHAQPACRSQMNVVFTLKTPELETEFLENAANEGLTTLGGHRSLGGIRASIYNAMPLEGVQALAQFMQDFAAKHG